MNHSAHTLLAKRQEQEKDRLAAQLASLLQQHKSLQEDVDDALKKISSIEDQLQDSIRLGITGTQLMAMENARQEHASRRKSLALQIEELREEERQLRQQMLACENKGKAHTRAQENIDRQQKRRSERIDQQRIDDMMAQRIGRENGQ